ncbi:MAG: hypothetical protein JST87_12055 [Bacteroidetes bacterium]|nr:hypothetical protein [Bacteroidota bacterium]
MSNNLWPSFENIPDIKTPKSVLLEQAMYLENASKNLLKVQIATGSRAASGKETIVYRFNIIAPFLGNYSFSLLTLEHDIFLYPLLITCQLLNRSYNIQTEKDFFEILKTIFNDQKTIDTINNLLSQSKAASQESGKT